MKKLLAQFLDMRPKDETDYCTFLIWQVSRKLAMTLVVLISVCCLCILWSTKPAKLRSGIAYRTYRYNALPLKFVTGKVVILGKSGYTAYIGDVERGVVKGKGTLYDPQGRVVYEGDFDANAYNGEGTIYHQNALPAYEGAFRNNLYDGAGKLYREDGTLWYDGQFDQGHMEGDGTLYSAAQEEIYKGFFQNDQILYRELIGKSAVEISDRYLGEREIYTGDEVYCVYMKEIDAVYFGTDRSNTLDEDFRVSGLYVLKREIDLAGRHMDQIPQLPEVLGEPVYEGNTCLEPEDEVALNICCETAGSEVLYGKSGFRSDTVFDDVTEVSDFDRDYEAYIYVYEKDGTVYTFFCKDKGAGFDFYRMEA